MADKKTNKTNAARLLDSHKIPYELIPYQVEETDLGAQHVADQLGEEFATEGKQFTRNWGMYLMYSRFADKDGVTRCMPDGLTPDVVAADRPADGIPLGDPAEVMLARTLSLCGYTPAPQAARRNTPVPAREKTEVQPLRPGFGLMIKEF